jgi:hypothetical protein
VRRSLPLQAGAVLVALTASLGTSAVPASSASEHIEEPSLYFVVLGSPALTSLPESERTPVAQRTIRGSQEDVVARARSLGAEIGYRYTRVLNGFSARLTIEAARSLRETRGVALVEPVGIVRRALARSVPLIGAPKTWKQYGVRGKGVTVAVVDTGIDYTHAAFNGPGTRSAYNQNNPDVREQGTFPTGKVRRGHDFVGDEYDVLDNDPTNDVPKPDPDPLDRFGHGTHVASTCCGKGVPGGHGRGVAPRAKIHAYKVWGDGGSSTADVLVAAYERTVDPNQDGDLSDRADVLNFSGGVAYGTASSAESLAAQGVVDAGTIFIAAAGNSGGPGYRVGTPATTPGVLSVAASNKVTDRVVSFSSSGPSRDDAAVKPEITAPGEGIVAAAVGSGNRSFALSGTSMAAPHVSGAAALLVDLRPKWKPEEIKAVLMNQAKRAVSARGIQPAPAMFMGAGRLRVTPSARARSVLFPGAVSFGIRHETGPVVVDGASFRVRNRDRRGHRYVIKSRHSYTNVPKEAARIQFSVNGGAFGEVRRFRLPTRRGATVTPRLHLNPDVLGAPDQVQPYHRELPVTDGIIVVQQRGGWKDKLKAPWLVVPYAAADVSAPDAPLDLSSGQADMNLQVGNAAGTAAADVYLLGTTDPVDPGALGEEDITHIGARSFTGAALGDGPQDIPTELDARGRSWLDQVELGSQLEEPVEFVVRTAAPHHTVETLGAKVFVDVGADGVFADANLQADYIVEKRALGEDVCIRDLSETNQPCSSSFGLDYSYFDSGLLGLVVDAQAIGLSDGETSLAYKVELCTDRFSGDVPQLECDESAGLEGALPATIDVTDPGIGLERWFCGGFWSAMDCSEPLTVTGSSGSPDLLVVFPNNSPGEDVAVVQTQ